MKLLNYYSVSLLKKKKYKILIKKTQKNKTQNTLSFGVLGLKTKEGGWMTPRQLEALRRIFSRKIKKIWEIFGYENYFLYLLQKNLFILEWVKVKVLLNTG